MSFIKSMNILLLSLIYLLKPIYISANYNGSPTGSLDTNHTRVFGPGLEPHVHVLPVRYFFIEAYNAEGKRIKKSLGNKIKVKVEGKTVTGVDCNVRVQVLDRYDGTYIARYRTLQTCQRTSIHVLYNYVHIAQSPYKILEPIYSDDCPCPSGSASKWSEAVDCAKSEPQIDADLSPFSDVDMDDVLLKAIERYHQPKARSFCNYVVLRNEVYRSCYGDHVGFSMFMDNILLSMARKMVLPALDFIVNLGDWPLAKKEETPVLPIFSWCGSEDSSDIVMPTYELTEATLEMLGRVTLDMLSVQSNNDIPWKAKKPVAFWRGRDSRRERLDLVTLSRQHTDIFNVSLTNFFFFRDEEKEFGPKANHESFFKFFDYKYQINIDGTVASYRLPYLLAGSGVIFKQDSPYYEHFYRHLEPNVHYIPFKRDLSDLVEKIHWAIDHDSEAQKIAVNGRKFALEHLLPKEVFCYHATLFQKWSDMLKSEVRVREGMTHVENKHNEKRFGPCKCHRLSHRDEL